VLDEARRMARLRHEHVVQVYGAEEHDGRVGLWMELVRGTSLEQLVRDRGALGANEASLIGLDICAALAAVHGSGLLHRDVKAQNVMREDGGRIVLMDFGTGEDLAGSNRLVGTPLYLAPEIFNGQKASVQSDIYAVGVLLYYLVTGKFPVSAESMEELARAHQRRDRRSLRDLRPDVPPTFVGVVERALDSDPARRYRTVGELDSAVRDSLVAQRTSSRTDRADGRGSQESRETVGAAGPRKSLRPFAPLLAAVVVALAIAAALLSRGLLTTRPQLPRIAVLPFQAEGGSERAPFLAEQLTDRLINAFGEVKALRVASLASVLPFKAPGTSGADAARHLHVDDVLLTSMDILPDPADKLDRVRIRTRLIAAGGGAAVWSYEYERSLSEIDDLNREIVKSVVETLGVELSNTEKQFLALRSKPSAATVDYLLGMHLLRQSSTDAEAAAAAFRRAIEIDPAHAGAHAGLARSLFTLGFVGTMQHPTARATASVEARKALELDPDSSEAHAVAADLEFFYDWDWEQADRSYRKAIELNPSFDRARSQYSRFLAAAGRAADAVAEARAGVSLEPTSASAMSTQAVAEYFGRDFQGALQSADRAIQLEASSPSHQIVRARILAAAGDLQGALEATERALSLPGASSVTSWRAFRLWVLALNGRHDEARTGMASLVADVHAARQGLSEAHLAYIDLALGEREKALGLLERAVADRDPEVLWISTDPRLDALEGDPRFLQLVSRLDIPRTPFPRP
jgi:TolB-like protein